MTEDRIAFILEHSEKGMFLTDICRLGKTKDKGFPAPRTVNEWKHKDPKFEARLKAARDVGYNEILEDTLRIADEAGNDFRYSEKAGGLVVDNEAIQRSKLRIETRLKVLAVLRPGVYGPKLELSGNPDRPMTAVQLTTEEILARLAASKAQRESTDE